MNARKFKIWLKLIGLEEKPYQVTGFEWCNKLETGDQKLKGGIISDEMGLGKTTLMLGCIILNPKRQTLIVVPPAILEQWERCIGKFLNGQQAFLYHGTNVRNMTVEKMKKYPIVLTTYGMIAMRKKGYRSVLWGVNWDRIIFDEAHHMRNVKTKICMGAFMLKAKFKWMVTGTPIQNSTSDLYVLFGLLGEGVRSRKRLKELIKKYVLRRTKKGVGLRLPEVETKDVIVKWESEKERNLSESLHSCLPFTGVSTANVDEIIDYMDTNPLSMMVRLRQICILPSLLNTHFFRLKEEGLIPEDFEIKKLTTQSKMSAVIKTIKQEPVEARKIIFTHYRGEIDFLEKKLRNEYTVGILDGRTKKRDRENVCRPPISSSLKLQILPNKEIWNRIDSFLIPNILLAQIQSASEGLNLQHFSQIYFTSPHWNPAVEDQALARAHRIGQKKRVKVFRFQMKPFKDGQLTLDNYCMVVQEKKREMMRLIDA